MSLFGHRHIIKMFLFFLIIAAVSCTSSQNKYKHQIFMQMGTLLEITLPEKNSGLLNEINSKVAELSGIITKDCEKISSSKDPVEINRITYKLLESELEYQQISERRFNSAVYTVAKLYGFPAGPFTTPSKESIAQAKLLMASEKVVLSRDDKAGKYYADGNGLKIDLGAYAKGWIVDEVSDFLRRQGVNNFIVNAGGDMYASGEKSKGTPWQMGITDPDGKKPYVNVVALSNKGLATSGSYERSFVSENGKLISHIFDATTGETSTAYKSISVIADSAVQADVFATIYYLMPADTISTLCKVYNTPVYTISQDNTEQRYCGWENYEIKAK